MLSCLVYKRFSTAYYLCHISAKIVAYREVSSSECIACTLTDVTDQTAPGVDILIATVIVGSKQVMNCMTIK